jgi:hypothetical protein
MNKKSISAEELMARLNADSRFNAERQLREDQHRVREAQNREAESSLVEELRQAGFEIESCWDLVNSSKPYPAAFPILLSHLKKPYPPAIREGIARALAVPDARSIGWSVLTRMFRIEQVQRVRDGIAAAIAAMADDDVLDEIIELVEDAEHGPSRLLLLSALERSSDPHADAALRRLLQDPALNEEIAVILRRRSSAGRRGGA